MLSLLRGSEIVIACLSGCSGVRGVKGEGGIARFEDLNGVGVIVNLDGIVLSSEWRVCC